MKFYIINQEPVHARGMESKNKYICIRTLWTPRGASRLFLILQLVKTKILSSKKITLVKNNPARDGEFLIFNIFIGGQSSCRHR